jgi:polysaccharide biosynthesis transport protein
MVLTEYQMKITELLSILWVRRWLALMTAGTVVAVVLCVSLVLPKTYVAESSVVVTPKTADPITGTQLMPQQASNYTATQMNVIQSRNVALKVVSDLQLAQQPGVQEKFQQATGGTGRIEDWLANGLLDRLDVRPTRESNVIAIDFSARDPKLAADAANAFANDYIKTSLELTLDPAKRQTLWFDEQVQGLRRNLEAAQQKLAASQKDRSIVGTDNKVDIETARLTDISTQLVAAQTRMYDTQSRQRQLRQAIDRGQVQELPDIAGNPVLQNLKGELVRAQGKFADISQRYDRNNPLYMSAAAEVKAIEDKIVSEVETTKGSISQSAQMAAQQVVELQSALDSQKTKILGLKTGHDQIDVLNRDVENAQKAYDAALQRQSQVGLESRMDQTNIAVLDSALAPAFPARPRILLNTALAIVLGCMLGAAIALGAELADRRVRSASDLATSSGLPVLAEIPVVPAAVRRAAVKAAGKRREPNLRVA